MIDLKNNNTIFWDFDGVILDSMEVRDLGFVEIFRDYPKEQTEALLAYHRLNGGWSRYVKIRYFFEEIRGESVTEEQVLEYAQKFSDVMLERLGDKERLIEDSVNFIENNFQRFTMFVVSGSDQKELRILCERLGLASYFKGIFGSPTPKKQLVKDIVEKHSLDRSRAVLIGDSINDFEAADVNGISFFGYNNESLRSKGHNYLDSFQAIKDQ